MSVPYRTYNITGGTIDGQSKVTCDQIASYSNLSKSTIYSRLNRNVFDIKTLSKPINRYVKPKERKKTKVYPQSAAKIMQSKPFYDEMFRLMLMKI